MKKLYNFIRTNYLYFIFYSFIGWIYELFFFLFEGELVNRGFLFGPYLPIYGIGSIFLIYLLKDLVKKKIKIKNINITPILIFISVFLITTIVEYIGHYVLDEYFNIMLWDYSEEYWNINGRVCFFASRNFAIMGTLGIYFVQPRLEKFLNKISEKKINFVFIILLIIFILDLVFSLIKL